MHIGSAVLYVVDVPAMTKLYEDVIGLAPIEFVALHPAPSVTPRAR
jgi:hypothetical protein